MCPCTLVPTNQMPTKNTAGVTSLWKYLSEESGAWPVPVGGRGGG
jgi:hypothetical protein